MTEITPAAALVAPVFIDAMAAAEKAADRIGGRKSVGADMLVIPEACPPDLPLPDQSGLDRRCRDRSVDEGGPDIALVCEAARVAGRVAVLGASERRADGRTCPKASFLIVAVGGAGDGPPQPAAHLCRASIQGRGDSSTLSVVDSAVGNIGAPACLEPALNLARHALADRSLEMKPALTTMAGFAGVANPQIKAMMTNHRLTAKRIVVAPSRSSSAGGCDVPEGGRPRSPCPSSGRGARRGSSAGFPAPPARRGDAGWRL